MTPKTLLRSTLAAATLSIAAIALAQSPAVQPSQGKPWVAPGTKGSPIDGTIFHAQVLLDVAGFPSGVIDGKKGMVFAKSISGFQQAHSLPDT